MVGDQSRYNSGQNKGKVDVRYEICHNKWTGPVEKALKALSGNKKTPVTEFEFLNIIKTNHNNIYLGLSFVQFYKNKNLNINTSDEVPVLQIAVCYLYPNPQLRDSLYKERENITNETGWYPLVMGEKIHSKIKSRQLIRHQNNLSKFDESIHIGKLHNIKRITSPDNGNSFLIEGENGCILLDTGTIIEAPLPCNIKAIFVSHFHNDHSGGLKNLCEYTVPLIMSEPTLHYLYERNKDYHYRNWMLSNVIVIDKILSYLQTSDSINIFPVFHSPGSYGISLRDSDGKWVFFPGDLCLKNGFLDASEELINYILSQNATTKWVLIDSSMAEREQIEISDEDTPRNITEIINEELYTRNVIFCCQSLETLLYQFILTFVHTAKIKTEDKAKRLFISNSLYQIAQTLLNPILYRKWNQIDPFIKSVIGKNIKNFIESNRVYPLRSLKHLPPGEKICIFLTRIDFINNCDEIKNWLFGGNLILAGKMVLYLEKKLTEAINTGKPRTVHRVSSPDWNFHSHEVDLVKFIKTLSTNGVNCLLFHDYPNKLDRFIKRNNFDPKKVITLKSNEIYFKR